MNLPTLEQVKTEKCRRSFFEFFKEAVQVLEPQTSWQFNWHIELMCNVMQKEIMRLIRGDTKENDLIFNVPPGSSKSKVFSVCLIPWAWIHAPHLRCATNSHNQKLATDHCMESRRLIATPWYQERWGHVFELQHDENTKTVFSNSKGGVRRATAQTGSHFDIIIGDDLLNPEKAISEQERENANELWFKTIPSRFRDLRTGLKVLVHQRLHEDDPTGVVLRRGLSYDRIVIPAELTEDVYPEELRDKYTDGLFWPERFSKKVLDDKRKELLSNYAGQYLQSPYPDEGMMIKKEWLANNIVSRAQVPDGLPVYFYSDTSFGKNDKGDPSATGAWIIDNSNGVLYILDMKVASLNVHEFVEEYIPFIEKNNEDWRSFHFFEDQATGPTIMDELKRSFPQYPVVADKLPSRESKEMRVQAALPKIAAGKVKLVEGEWNDFFIKECMAFPRGRHDDQVDVLSSIVRLSDLTVYEEGEERDDAPSGF